MIAVSKVLLSAVNFQENAIVNLKQIWRTKEFTDVTLVSSDGLKLEAHKTVLCSSSSFFRDILIENQHPSVLLYMRGVNHKELELLLELAYTGECQVEGADLFSLLRTGKDLGIKGLLENTVGNEVLRIEKHSNMDNEMIEEAPSTEPKKLRITTSDLMSGFHESPVNIEKSLEKNSEHSPEPEPKMVYETNEEALEKELNKSGFDAINVKLQMDKKPEHLAMFGGPLEEFSVKSSTKTEEKKAVEIEAKCADCSMSFRSRRTLKAHQKSVHAGRRYICVTNALFRQKLKAVQ